MSGKRRAAGPVRQLSLQQSARRHPRKEETGRLRRQASEDHGLRVLASHIVTPGECENKPRTPQPVVVRPRPVRLAWADRRQVTVDSEPPVGVVVQRCKGLPRPVTAKPARAPAAPESILYSRQELAERLRLAWKDRQERPNLDIFLAHNSLDKSDPEEAFSVREIQTEVEKNRLISEDSGRSSRFTPFSDGRSSSAVRSPDVFNSFRRRDDPPDVPRLQVPSVQTFPTTTFPLAAFRESSDSEKESPPIVTVISPKVESGRKLTPSITISFDHGVDSDDQRVNENDEEVPSQAKPDDNLLKPGSYSGEPLRKDSEEVSEETKNDKKENDKPKKDNLTATMRRANFRNMNNNPVMSGTVSSATPPSTPAPSPGRPILKKPSGQPLQRMMSAPVSGRTTPARKDVAPRLEARNDSLDLDYDEDDMAIVQRETRVKSAPARRKFKSGRKKGPKSHEDDSSEDEFGLEEVPPVTKPRHRKRFVEKAAEIVTMVSLLSPAESEAEDAPVQVVQLPDTWAAARAPAHETKTEARPPATVAAAPATPATVAATGILCLRKFPVKTVSFQQGTPPNRSYTASYPSRRGAGSPLILPPPEPSPPPAPPPPPPPPLARRRLTKSKSAGPLGQENSIDGEPPEVEDVSPVVPETLPPPPPAQAPVPPPGPHSAAPACPRLDPADDPVADPESEPTFKTAKEKECWQMFRKMTDKGVAVSYDTVLRGMLTPTEYRLHKKSMSSTC